MFMKDKNKSLSLIIAKMKKPEGEEMSEAPKSEDGGEVDNSIGIDSAAEEIMSAIEGKDPKGLVAALKSFMEMSAEEEPMPEEPEQEPV